MIRGLFALGLLVLATTAARASYVHIEVSGPSQPYISQYDSAFLAASGTGFVAGADLIGGSLGAYARHDGSASTYHAQASGFLYAIDLANGGVDPVTIGGSLSPLTLDVTAATSDGGDGNGLTYHTVYAGIVGWLNGVDVPGSSFSSQYSVEWLGTTATYSPLALSTTNATVTQASFNAVAATLAFPEVTLNPGDHLSLNVALAVDTSMVTNYGYGPTGVTDAATIPAQLRLTLPYGAVIVTDAGVPLDWIAVPEPSLAGLVALALALGALTQNSSS